MKNSAAIVLKALEEPVRQIAINAGRGQRGEEIKRSGKVGYGFDAYNEKYVDMITAVSLTQLRLHVH